VGFPPRARQLGVQGVSLESCYLPVGEEPFLARLRDTLDEMDFDRVWAWATRQGLCSGTNRAAAKDLVRHLGIARRLGALGSCGSWAAADIPAPHAGRSTSGNS